MPRGKEPGIEIEEAKAKLRLEEAEAETKECADCTRVRVASGDPTTFCAEHLRRIYGL